MRSLSMGFLAALLSLASGCGDDETVLTVDNDFESSGTILVSIQPCVTRYWKGPPTRAFETSAVSAPVSVAHGESHDFTLTPGCHDVIASPVGSGAASTSASSDAAYARIVLDVGQTATWVPFQVKDNDSWWCEEDCKDDK
jgi:hypothetical protein